MALAKVSYCCLATCYPTTLNGVVFAQGVVRAPTRFHKSYCWRGSRVAARGARAASRAHAADRRADGLSRERPGRTGVLLGIPGRTSEARVDRRPQHPARHARGVARRHGGETAVGEGTRRATTRCHSLGLHTQPRLSPTTYTRPL